MKKRKNMTNVKAGRLTCSMSCNTGNLWTPQKKHDFMKGWKGPKCVLAITPNNDWLVVSVHLKKYSSNWVINPSRSEHKKISELPSPRVDGDSFVMKTGACCLSM